MDSANMTRREFLKGALVSLGFGAFGGRRLFAAPLGWKHGGTPNLVFGVVSDGVHPNDWGMVSLAKAYGNAVQKALGLPGKTQTN